MSFVSSLSWACTLLQSASSSKPPPRHQTFPDPIGRCGSSHEVLRPFSVSPLAAAASLTGLSTPDRLRPQVFSTSRRLLNPPRACRPCFMPDPLMGLHPSELCSCRVAVRCLQRRSPLDVGPCSPPSRPSLTSRPPKWMRCSRRLRPSASAEPARRRSRSMEPLAHSQPPKRPPALQVHPFPQSRSPVEAGCVDRSSKTRRSLRCGRLGSTPRDRSLDETERAVSPLCREAQRPERSLLPIGAEAPPSRLVAAFSHRAEALCDPAAAALSSGAKALSDPATVRRREPKLRLPDMRPSLRSRSSFGGDVLPAPPKTKKALDRPDICPLFRNPKVPSDRTYRSPVRDPKIPAGSSDSARLPSRPKPRWKTGGCSPASPEPKLLCRRTSRPSLENPKALSLQLAPPLPSKPEGSVAASVLPARISVTEIAVTRTTRFPSLEPEDSAEAKQAALLCRSPKTSPASSKASFLAELRRARRIQTPAPSPPQPKRLLRSRSWRSPLRDRSPVDSSTSVRSVPGRSLLLTERAVEMATRASSPSGV
jgi:hypothetical protein